MIFRLTTLLIAIVDPKIFCSEILGCCFIALIIYSLGIYLFFSLIYSGESRYFIALCLESDIVGWFQSCEKNGIVMYIYFSKVWFFGSLRMIEYSICLSNYLNLSIWLVKFDHIFASLVKLPNKLESMS